MGHPMPGARSRTREGLGHGNAPPRCRVGRKTIRTKCKMPVISSVPGTARGQ